MNKIMCQVNYSHLTLSTFNEAGSLKVCVKFDFLHKLESMCETKVTTMEMTDCIIFDAMTVIQILPVPSKTKNVTFVGMAE